MEKIISDKYAIELIHSLSHLWLLFGLALLIFIIGCAALVAREPVPHSTHDKQANSTSKNIKQMNNKEQKVEPTTETSIVGNTVLSAGLSTLKAHYIVGNRTGTCQTETIHFQRKGAIAKFLEGSNMTWEDCVKSGWQVYKVDIVFQPCR